VFVYYQETKVQLKAIKQNESKSRISPSSSSSSSSLVTENHQRTDVYFPAHAW
jgi:hypothetical protein